MRIIMSLASCRRSVTEKSYVSTPTVKPSNVKKTTQNLQRSEARGAFRDLEACTLVTASSL